LKDHAKQDLQPSHGLILYLSHTTVTTGDNPTSTGKQMQLDQSARKFLLKDNQDQLALQLKVLARQDLQPSHSLILFLSHTRMTIGDNPTSTGKLMLLDLSARKFLLKDKLEAHMSFKVSTTANKLP